MIPRLSAARPRGGGYGLFLGVMLAASLLHAQPQSDNLLERKLQRIMVPTVNFRDASLDAVLDFLTTIPVTTKQAENPVNIVKAYKSTNPSLGDARITLSLNNVPWTEVLRYVCISANVRVSYESHAIFVSAPPPPSSASPSPTP